MTALGPTAGVLYYLRKKIHRGEMLEPWEHEEWLAYARRMADKGAVYTGRTLDYLTTANARALDVLSRIVSDSLDFVWMPGVEEGEARRMLGRAMAERGADPGPEPRNLSEAEFNEAGVAFAPFVTDEQRAAFLDALTREAEKRVLVMPGGVEFAYTPAPAAAEEQPK